MKEAKRKYSQEDGKLLVTTARKTVEVFLKNNSKLKNPEFESRFNFDSGVFVTINKQGNLRGCIGYPLPIRKLSESLIDASIAAATQDPRFSPVTLQELDNIIFEVTVLTNPEEIKASNPAEYLSAIKVGRDGLIVKKDDQSGLLLPQVPLEYGWDEEEFLGHTCEKAGLERDTWRDNPSAKILKFQGIVFKEKFPNSEDIEQM